MRSIHAVVAMQDVEEARLIGDAIAAVDAAIDVTFCDDAAAIRQAVGRQEIAIACIDLDLPGSDPWEVAVTLKRDDACAVLLAVRDPRDALRSYTEGFVDCIARPLQPWRSELAVQRARRYVAQRDANRLSRELSETLKVADTTAAGAATTYTRRLVISSGARSHVVLTESIEWVSAEDCYSRIHVAGRTHLFRCTLAELQRRLDPHQFVRVHRSALVNVEYVREIRQLDDGTEVLVLASQAVVPVSQRRRREVLDRLVLLERAKPATDDPLLTA